MTNPDGVWPCSEHRSFWESSVKVGYLNGKPKLAGLPFVDSQRILDSCGVCRAAMDDVVLLGCLCGSTECARGYIKELEAKLARVEALISRWRELSHGIPTADRYIGVECCAEELQEALKEKGNEDQ